MTEREIELLKMALELYAFSICQRKDDNEENEFYIMREKLSEIVGSDLT